MKKTFSLIFLYYSFTVVSQNKTLDSLFSVLKIQKEDTNKVNMLVAIGDELKLISEYDKATENSNKALKLAQTLNYKRGIAYAYINLGNTFQNTGNYPEALVQYDFALKIFEATSDKKGIAKILNNKGIIYNNQGDNLNALKSFIAALVINRELDNKKQVANNYSNIGSIYFDLGNYSESLKNHFASLKLREEIKDKRDIAGCHNNIGLVYEAQKNYSLALENYSKALQLYKETNNQKGIAYVLNNIGVTNRLNGNNSEALKNYNAALSINQKAGDLYGSASNFHNIALIYDEKENYGEAIKNYMQSLEISKKIEDELSIATILSNLGGLNIKQKKYSEARKYLTTSIDICKSIGSKDMLSNNYWSLSRLDSITNNYQNSLVNYKYYILYKDSLINEESSRKIIQSQMQYDFDKKENKTKIEQAKKDAKAEEEKRNKEFLLIGLLSLIFVILIIAWLLFRQSKLKSEQKAIQLEQKLLRTQMNPHFIFNSLTSIDSYIGTQDQSLARKYLASFSKLMRNILENSREEYITLQKEINTLEDYLNLQKINHEENFTYHINLDETIDVHETRIPPMLLQPFIENAIKHGITSSKQGQIDISFKQADNNLMVEIKDNGLGITKSEHTIQNGHVSLSTTITQERLANINSRNKLKIAFQIQDLSVLDKTLTGTLVTFTIPIS